MDHWKSERVAYRFGIRNFRSFGLAETQKFGFYSVVVLSRTDSNSLPCSLLLNLLLHDLGSLHPCPLSSHSFLFEQEALVILVKEC
jgi:hypothetical protein